MNLPIVVDKEDPKWVLLGNILKIFDSRRVKQEIAKQGIKPARKAGIMYKVVIISLFFSKDISYVVSELKKREELRKFMGILDVPSEHQIYEFLGRFTEEQIMDCSLGILNTLCKPRKRGKAIIIVDSTDISVDLNSKLHKYTKKSQEGKAVQWCYSKSKGYYLGFKLTMALDYKTLRPMCFILHTGCTHDSKLFKPIMNEMRRRRLIRKEDTIVFDRGYYKYDNYRLGITEYKIVPIIFPHKNMNLNRVLNTITYPFSAYKKGKLPEKVKKLFQRITRQFKHKIQHWREFQSKRGLIEDIFTLKKEGFSFKKLHRYTHPSVLKIVSIAALLAGTITSQGYNTNQKLQKLAAS
jgi:hypothetical protein